MPFKIRTKLIIAFFAIIFPFIIIAGILAFYNASAFHKAAHKVESVSEERAAITNIILVLERAVMPGNDYIITGDKKYIDDFYRVSEDIEKRITEAEGILSGAEDMNMLRDAKLAWRNIKDISQKIFEIQNPLGNKAAASLMEEMDYRWAYPAIERLKKWRGMHLEEYKKAVNVSHKVWVRSWIIMGIVVATLIISGVSFAMFYSNLFVRPIKAIHNGADYIARGEFKTRLDIKTGDELQQLSGAMNEMAEQLDSFFSDFDRQLDERTAELRESEEKYKTMIESANDVIWALDREGLIIFINNQAEKVSGYTLEETMGKHYLTFVHPEDRGMREEYFKRTLSGERTQFTVRASGKDHGERTLILQINSAPIYKEGKIVGTVNFGRDITELKKTEEALRESEERYRGIFEKTPNAMVVFDAETWRFENVNRAAIDLYGYPEEEFHSMTPADISAEVEKTRKAVQDGLAEKYVHVPVRYHKKKDGTVFPIEIFMGIFLSGGRQKGFAVIVDLTEIKKREEMLLESEERYRVLGMTAPNAMICLKAPDTVTFWNRRAKEIFGYSEEEVIGKPMHGLIVPERYREKAGDGMKNFFKTGTGPVVGKKTELSALRRDGTEFPIELSLSAMNIRGEWQATGIVRDITDRKQAEEAIKESETRFRGIVETAKDAVLCIEEGGGIYLWNKSAEGMFGYRADEAIGKDIHSLVITERDREKAYKGIKTFFQTGTGPIIGKTIEAAGLRKDGTEFPVEISVSAINIKNKWHAVGIIRDITERKKAEDKIKEQMDYLVRFEKATVQREFRMKELRDRVKELEEEMKKHKL